MTHTPRTLRIHIPMLALLALSAVSLRTNANSVVAHWTLNDNVSTPVVVESTAGRHGTIQNNPNHFSSELHAPGHVGTGCFNFAGTTAHVTVPDASWLRITNHLSIACWAYINPNGPNMVGKVVALMRRSTGAPALGGWQMVWDDRGTVSDGVRHKAITFYTLHGASYAMANTNFAITNAGWYHLVGIYDAATSIRLFINGTLAASGPSMGSIYYSPNIIPFSIGGGIDGVALDGRMDDVRIFPRLLTTNEIATLYNSGQGTEARLDGDEVPMEARIRFSEAEICWPSQTGKLYNVEYILSLPSQEWVPIYTNIVGNGLMNCVYDSLDDGEVQKLYRVVTPSP